MPLRPDPSFCPSPRLAKEAPSEKHAYVTAIDPAGIAGAKVGEPDALTAVDRDPASPRYGTVPQMVAISRDGKRVSLTRSLYAGQIMTTSRRSFLKAGVTAAGAFALAQVGCKRADGKRKLRFGVGPLLPSADDTKNAYTPFFAYLAQQLDADFELVSTTDWAGMAVAMGSGQLDLAWMGPWGYVLAASSTGCTALATVKYDEKPIYHAIVIGRPDLNVAKFPDDTKGLSISFADVGSTSGWLIPTWYAKEVWKIDPKTFWKYSEGATHAANEMAVQGGQVDLATDYDRNRNAMIESSKVKPDSNKIIWTSDPLPNDCIAVAKGTPQEFVDKVQKFLVSITPEQAKTLLPNHYTGFVAATHASYESIEKAGIAVGKIKPRT